MAKKVTVACPHCGSTGTHEVGVENGTSRGHCKQCKKSFPIHMKKGEVDKVVK